MSKLSFLICLLPILLLLPGKPARANERYTFDKEQTTISFSVSHFGFFEVEGEFADYDGDFVISAQHPERDAIAITLFPASIHTTSQAMEKELRGPDFFNVEQFSTVSFVSTAVESVDKNDAKIMGNLTLLNVTRPVTFDAHFTDAALDPKNNDDAVGFSASGVIKRSDFGMDAFVPVIGDEVHLHIEVSGLEKEN